MFIGNEIAYSFNILIFLFESKFESILMGYKVFSEGNVFTKSIYPLKYMYP